MPKQLRSPRLYWIAGLVLLIGTVVSAGFVFNSGVRGSGDSATAVPAAPSLAHDVMSLGYVDNRDGVSGLYPVQPGRVKELRKEDFVAKKGDWLLRLDNRFAKYRLEEAKADRDAAVAQLRQAKVLPEQHQRKLEQQQAAVAAARHHKLAKEEALKTAEKAFKDNVISMNALVAAQEEVKGLESLLKVEEGKLEELKLSDPSVGLKRAEADLAAKESRVEQAELALIECDILAPCDGVLLRVLTHEGETLGANPKIPALQFAHDGPKIIRAEVQQEWANRVQPGQKVTIQDDTFAGPEWTGKVERMSGWFTNTRSVIIEPFMFNDVRTLECIIQIDDQKSPLRIGQRVRVRIHSGS